MRTDHLRNGGEPDYIHNNPVNGNWSLVDDPANYPYSSAGYYMLGSAPVVPLMHVGELL